MAKKKPKDQSNSEPTTNWVLAEPKKKFEKFFEDHTEFIIYIPEFEADVTENPFRHETHKKICKLQPNDAYPPGCYRWRKKDLRIVYSVIKQQHLILPLDANTAGDIDYKK